MLDEEVLYVYTGEYEEKRAQKKLGVGATAIIVFKTCLGLALFGFHQVFQISGLWLGLAIAVVTLGLMVHGSMRAVGFAEELESESLDSLRIENYFELVELVEVRKNGSGRAILSRLLFYLVILSVFCSCISQTMIFNSILTSYLGIPLSWSNAILLVCIVSLLVCMLQPEKLIWVSILAMAVYLNLVVLSLFFGSKELVRSGLSNKAVTTYSFRDLSCSFGYVLGTVDVLNTLFNIRRLSKPEKRRFFTTAGYFSLYSASFVVVVPSLVMYLAYQGRGLTDLYYETFSKEFVVKACILLIPLNQIIGISKACIFTVEMLEKIKLFQRCIRNEGQEISGLKVFLFRLLMLFGVGFAASFLSDVRKVYSMIGIFCNATISLIVPGLLAKWRPRYLRGKETRWTKLKDWLCVFVGGFIICVYVLEKTFLRH